MYVRTFFISTFMAFAMGGTAFAQNSPVKSMEGFYAKSKKSLISSTGAGVYESQSRYALTGGSFVWRAPQENVVALSAQLPSITAGCGGIDIFAGSFSFINGEQLEALFRAILQDAAGYAFSLALKEISPQISTTLESMWNAINEVNGKNINSCEAAQAIVDTTIDKYNAAKEKTCAVTGSMEGVFEDALAGRACGDKKSSDVDSAAKAKDEDYVTPLNQNFAMEASGKSHIADDFDLREFWMSITGTLVIQTDKETEFMYIPPINLKEGVVRAMMSGGTIYGHSCKSVNLGGTAYPKEDCFAVDQGNNEINVPASEGFLVRVRDTMGTIYDKASGVNKTAFTDDEKAFIEDTPLPILRASQLYSQAYPSIGKSMLLSYSELIAYNITLKFLEETSRNVLEYSSSNTGANADELESWRLTVQRNIDTLVEQQSRLQLRFNAVQTFISELRALEGRVTARVNSNLLRTAQSGN